MAKEAKRQSSEQSGPGRTPTQKKNVAADHHVVWKCGVRGREYTKSEEKIEGHGQGE